MRPAFLTLTFVFALLAGGNACSQGFAALVSPPRFEVKAHPGSTVRQILEITNRSVTPGKYRLRTADFTLGADYGVVFHDELLPGSCRPWVAIERPEVTLPGGGTIRYRFEVQVPRDVTDGECRFGILIEGDEAAVAQSGSVRLPIVGRIGVIVYVAIGNGRPNIQIFGPNVVTVNGRRVPALRVLNDGNVHTRMSGFLSGKDADGRKYDFTPSDLPILPGETRDVLLSPSTPGNDSPTLSFPVTIQGTLEWADQSTELNERFK